MSKKSMDINDDEIRVISPSSDSQSVKTKKGKSLLICIALSVFAVL